MPLLISSTPRTLENKLKLLGFELLDLLLIFLYLSISNLLFGQTSLKVPLVWIGTLILTIILYFVKKDKPDGYLGDYLSSLVNPNIFSANLSQKNYVVYGTPASYRGEKNEFPKTKTNSKFNKNSTTKL